MYQTNISVKENDNIVKAYVGMTGLNWKFRYYNYLLSFWNPTLKNQTARSKYYWDLIELGITSVMNWKIIKRSSTTKRLHAKCLEEKICILRYFNKNRLILEKKWFRHVDIELNS